MSEAETCADDGCTAWPRYPTTDGRRHFREHYDGPATFEHVPEPRRTELKERYDK